MASHSPGDIVVISTENISVFQGFYGGVASHNLVWNNTAGDNEPFDVVTTGWAPATASFPTGVAHRFPPISAGAEADSRVVSQVSGS